MRLTKNSYIENAVSFKGRGQLIDRTIVHVAAFGLGRNYYYYYYYYYYWTSQPDTQIKSSLEKRCVAARHLHLLEMLYVRYIYLTNWWAEEMIGGAQFVSMFEVVE